MPTVRACSSAVSRLFLGRASPPPQELSFDCSVTFSIRWSVAFVASTMQGSDLINSVVPLWPGDHFLENYATALQAGSKAAGGASLVGSLVG